jgi:hypothetical protein
VSTCGKKYLSFCGSAAAAPTTRKTTTAAATAANNENVSESSLGDGQSTAARVGNKFVVHAAVGVGSGRGI